MSDNDIIVWSDSTWCYRYELNEYTWMSDDYLVLPADSVVAAAWVDAHE